MGIWYISNERIVRMIRTLRCRYLRWQLRRAMEDAEIARGMQWSGNAEAERAEAMALAWAAELARRLQALEGR